MFLGLHKGPKDDMDFVVTDWLGYYLSLLILIRKDPVFLDATYNLDRTF